MWVYGYMDMWVCGYMGIWVCGYMDMWVYIPGQGAKGVKQNLVTKSRKTMKNEFVYSY